MQGVTVTPFRVVDEINQVGGRCAAAGGGGLLVVVAVVAVVVVGGQCGLWASKEGRLHTQSARRAPR